MMVGAKRAALGAGVILIVAMAATAGAYGVVAIRSIKAQNAAMQAQLSELRSRNQALSQSSLRLETAVGASQRDNGALAKEVEGLRALVASLSAQLATPAPSASAAQPYSCPADPVLRARADAVSYRILGKPATDQDMVALCDQNAGSDSGLEYYFTEKGWKPTG